MKRLDPKQRFWNNVAKGPDSDCWEWLGSKSKSGYGKIYVSGKHWRANRYSYFIHHGEIVDELFVCHRCDNPGCVNPSHLFLGTVRDNVLDSVGKGRWFSSKITHCPQGHEYTTDNTRFYKNKRQCRTCARVYDKKRYSNPERQAWYVKKGILKHATR